MPCSWLGFDCSGAKTPEQRMIPKPYPAIARFPVGPLLPGQKQPLSEQKALTGHLRFEIEKRLFAGKSSAVAG